MRKRYTAELTVRESELTINDLSEVKAEFRIPEDAELTEFSKGAFHFRWGVELY